MFSKEIRDLSETLIEECQGAGLSLTAAESCTGGLIAGALTTVPGASNTFGRGWVTYSNEAKTDLLGVPETYFAQVGAVSEEVARAMAEGALERAETDLAIAVTGIAGPGGGSKEKPVGLVHIAAARRGRETMHERHVFPGDRDAVRDAAVAAGLRLLLRQIA